jgi:hypothetical protein
MVNTRGRAPGARTCRLRRGRTQRIRQAGSTARKAGATEAVAAAPG